MSRWCRPWPDHRPRRARELRLWVWSGLEPGDSYTRPIHDGRPDPALDATTELSYGWTRRGLNSGTTSRHYLAGDRAQASPEPTTEPGLAGNHAEGANVLKVDGTITWFPAGEGAHLADVTLKRHEKVGFLSVRPPTRPGPRPWRADGWALAALPVLVALLLLARRMLNARPPSSAPAGTCTPG